MFKNVSEYIKDHIFELRRKIYIHNLTSCEIKAWKKKSLALRTHRSYSLLTVQVFLMKFFSKEVQILHCCLYFDLSQAAFSCHHSVQGILSMASNKPFNCDSRLWLLLSRIILSQACSNPRKWWHWRSWSGWSFGKNTLFWPCEEHQISRRLSWFPPVSSWTDLRPKNTASLPSTVSKWRPRPKSNFVLLSRRNHSCLHIFLAISNVLSSI